MAFPEEDVLLKSFKIDFYLIVFFEQRESYIYVLWTFFGGIAY